MNRRPPMSPPAIPGFRFERLLGSGGYSDVFLYEQEMPRRLVAIKVLLADRLDDRALQLVADEANAMAAVSTHPYIVTIFHADIGRGGNPYIVMEYYPRPNYSVRARKEQIPVADVLRAGIQVASAVETAHRAGIIHRDIKPANVLTSEYGRPGLTDFGIAGLSDGSTDAAEGLSVPWSPPEIIDGDVAGDVASDVYSLGATIYTLLAGRSPFEVTGGANSTLDLLERIKRGDLPPTGRGDVPPTFERLLRHAMARRPEDRPSSAADLARALQDIEVQQQFAMTPLEVREEDRGGRARVVEGDDDGTRLKSPTVIQSQSASARAAPTSGAVSGVPSLIGQVPTSAPEGATVQRSSIGADSSATAPELRFQSPTGAIAGTGSSDSGGAGTSVRSEPPLTGEQGNATTRPSRISLVRVAWIALLVVALLFVARLLTRDPEISKPTTTTSNLVDGGSGPISSDDVPAPTDVVVTPSNGGVHVTWTIPAGASADDFYSVGPKGATAVDPAVRHTNVGEASADLSGWTDCVDVRSIRNGVQSKAATGCPGGP